MYFSCLFPILRVRKGNLLPPHRPLFPISSKVFFFICIIPDRIIHTTAFVTPVVGHWLEREIAQWVHPMKDRSDDPSHHERTLLRQSYILLLFPQSINYRHDISPNVRQSLITISRSCVSIQGKYSCNFCINGWHTFVFVLFVCLFVCLFGLVWVFKLIFYYNFFYKPERFLICTITLMFSNDI